jgi:hypothetical protein
LGEGRGGNAGICHGGGELSLGGSSGRRGEGRGKRAGGQKRGARAALGLGIDAWRWRTAGGGEGRPETAGDSAAEEQRSRGCGRRGEEVRGTSLEIEKNLRDFTVNRIFPQIERPNEEMVKIEVVELFKSYNFDLGLKFRNLKYTALFYNFALNSNLIKFLSLVM